MAKAGVMQGRQPPGQGNPAVAGRSSCKHGVPARKETGGNVSGFEAALPTAVGTPA